MHLCLLSYQKWVNRCKQGGRSSQCIIFTGGLKDKETHFPGEDPSLNPRIFSSDNSISSNGFIQTSLNGLDSNHFFHSISIVSDIGSEKTLLAFFFFFFREKSKQELISVSRPACSSTCQVWRSSACLITDLIPQCSGCVTEDCDSRLCTLTH